MSNKLTIKEEKAVKAAARHGNKTQAVLDAGYTVKDRKAASEKAARIFKRPHVQNALATELELLAPDADTEVARSLLEAINAPLVGSPQDDGTRVPITRKERLAYIEAYNRIKGNIAPSKSLNLSAKIAKLPEG